MSKDEIEELKEKLRVAEEEIKTLRCTSVCSAHREFNPDCDTCKTQVVIIPLVDYDALQSINTRYREALEKAVGFCVHIRETDPEWYKHQEVGQLFAVATTALEGGER